jgi:hypothetical protein
MPTSPDQHDSFYLSGRIRYLKIHLEELLNSIKRTDVYWIPCRSQLCLDLLKNLSPSKYTSYETPYRMMLKRVLSKSRVQQIIQSLEECNQTIAEAYKPTLLQIIKDSNALIFTGTPRDINSQSPLVTTASSSIRIPMLWNFSGTPGAGRT